MSLLDKGTSGRIERSHINVIYGDEGTGKTSFAAKFPKTIYLDIENGSAEVAVEKRFQSDLVGDYQTLLKMLDTLLLEQHQYKTLAIDSISELERYIHREICGTKYSTIEDAEGGFGKGFSKAEKMAADLMRKLQELRNKKGMTINLVGHSMKKATTEFFDKITYDRYIINCNEKFARVLKQAADNVLFVRKDVSTVTDQRTKKVFADSTGDVIMSTEWRPAADAKNRLNLPFEINFDYQAFVVACKESKPRPASEVMADIEAASKSVEPEMRAKALARAKEVAHDVSELTRIKNKLQEYARTQQDQPTKGVQ